MSGVPLFLESSQILLSQVRRPVVRTVNIKHLLLDFQLFSQGKNSSLKSTQHSVFIPLDNSIKFFKFTNIFQGFVFVIDNSIILCFLLRFKRFKANILKSRENLRAIVPMMTLLADIAAIEYPLQFLLDEKLILQKMIRLLKLDISQTLLLEGIPRDEIQYRTVSGDYG